MCPCGREWGGGHSLLQFRHPCGGEPAEQRGWCVRQAVVGDKRKHLHGRFFFAHSRLLGRQCQHHPQGYHRIGHDLLIIAQDIIQVGWQLLIRYPQQAVDDDPQEANV